MTLAHLDNLVRIKQLKAEPPDQNEFEGVLNSAKCRFQDVRIEVLSEDSRFSLTYGAAHSLALVAALVWLPLREPLSGISWITTHGGAGSREVTHVG